MRRQQIAMMKEAARATTPDNLISFEDGKRYKILRRHLIGSNLTPQEYRAN